MAKTSPDLFSIKDSLASNDTQISFAERQMVRYYALSRQTVYMGLKMRPLSVSVAEHRILELGGKIQRGREYIVCNEKIQCSFTNGWKFVLLLCSNEGDK